MPRLIVKVNYGRTKSYNLNYVNYIATREGVETMPVEQRTLPATDNQLNLIHELLERTPDLKDSSEYQAFVENRTIERASEFISAAVEENVEDLEIYMNYIATRPRAERMGDHGLFSDEEHVDLEAEKKVMQSHKGNVWRFIISLTREDAERIGFDNASAWRDLMRSQRTMLAEQMKIPLSDLRWVAAFHNERHHPHIHMMVYSKNPSKGFLTEQGLEEIKSTLANDLFQDDLLTVYKDMTQRRDDLTAAARMRVNDLMRELATVTPDECDHMTLFKAQLIEIAKQLDGIGGKKVYGYLPPALKNLVDEATATLAKDERIAELYNLWYEKKYDTLRTYTDNLPEQIPLAINKEFKSIKNAIIKAAATMTVELPEDETPIEAPIAESEAFSEFAESIAEAQSDMGSEAAPWEAPLPEPPPEEALPWETLPSEQSYEEMPPAGEYTVDLPPRGSNGNNSSWWNARYLAARACLYGTEQTEPDHDKAMILLLEEAAIGNGYAMYDIGRMKLNGLACEKNEDEAQEWFRKAHDAFLSELPNQKNPSYLQYRIGKLYAMGHGVEQDYTTAAKWYDRSVPNPFAAYALGSLYRRGEGVEQNDVKALELYEIAANDPNKPNAYAMYELGVMYRDGIGTTVNVIRSEEWFAQAYPAFEEIVKTMPDDKLFYRLGQMNYAGIGTEVDLNKAQRYFEKAAEFGNLHAEYRLGKLYLSPDFEKRDVDKGIEHMTKAAEGELDFAQYALGKLYLIGDAIPQDIEKARYWLEAAVEKENESAMNLLGKELLKGERFTRDTDRAETLLQQAIDKGNLFAAYTLGKAYLKGDVLEKDIPKSIELLEKAVHEKAIETFAAYALGTIYLKEQGFKDSTKAIEYLTVASDRGNHFADYLLGKAYLYDKDFPNDREEGLRLLRQAADRGNTYAADLLNQMQNHTTASLLTNTAQLFKNAFRNQQYNQQKRSRAPQTDSKLRREIEAKRQGQDYAV